MIVALSQDEPRRTTGTNRPSMSVEKLERVLWRLRKRNPGVDKPSYLELRRAIMLECGTCEATYKSNKRALKFLGWIAAYNSKRCKLTNKDLNES